MAFAELTPYQGEDGFMLEGFWPQNGFRIDLTGSGGASYVQVGPRGSDFRGPGVLTPKFKAPKTPKQFLINRNT